MFKRQRLMEASVSHLTTSLGAPRTAAWAGATSTARGHGALGYASGLTQMLERLCAHEQGAAASLYASDITFSMPLPEPDEARGEAAPTQTRSGVMDSLLRASLLRFSPLIPGVNYPMTYIGARNTFFCWHVEDNHLYATNYLQVNVT